jgi:5-methyltetrahydrofolate--homocysteine methyltransferase
VAAFLGARVGVDENTVWFHPSRLEELGEIAPTFDEQNAWWQRVREVTAIGVDRWAGRACVSYTDLGGNLDILASLRTTEGLLLDTLDSPEELARCVDGVTAVWLECYDRLDALIAAGGVGRTPWAPIWSPRRTYMLQSDFAYMISPAMFERFVLPDLQSCCERMDDGFYHLDGKGQLAHLPLLCDMDRLRGIQWVPGDGQPEAADWLDVLATIRRAGKLCQVFASPAGALKIIDEHDGGRGFVLAVDGAEFASPSAVTDFLAEVERRCGSAIP